MLDKSFYHGKQGECFRQLDKHWSNIKHEFDTQPNKTFLDPEDFSDSVRGLPDDFDDRSGDYVNGQWRALGCLLYTSPSPRDLSTSRMPSSA